MSCFPPSPPRSLRPHPASAGTGRGVRPSRPQHGNASAWAARPSPKATAAPGSSSSAPRLGSWEAPRLFILQAVFKSFQDKQRRGKKEDQKKKKNPFCLFRGWWEDGEWGGGGGGRGCGVRVGIRTGGDGCWLQKSKENKPPSHLTKRNQSWLFGFSVRLLCKAEMGSWRLNLWLNPFANMHWPGERRGRLGLQCKLSPPTPLLPPTPTPGQSDLKGGGLLQKPDLPQPRRQGRAQNLSSSVSLQTPAAPSASLLLFSSGSGLQKHIQKNHSLRGGGEGGGGRGGERRGPRKGGGGRRGEARRRGREGERRALVAPPPPDWSLEKRQAPSSSTFLLRLLLGSFGSSSGAPSIRVQRWAGKEAELTPSLQSLKVQWYRSAGSVSTFPLFLPASLGFRP